MLKTCAAFGGLFQHNFYLRVISQLGQKSDHFRYLFFLWFLWNSHLHAPDSIICGIKKPEGEEIETENPYGVTI